MTLKRTTEVILYLQPCLQHAYVRETIIRNTTDYWFGQEGVSHTVFLLTSCADVEFSPQFLASNRFSCNSAIKENLKRQVGTEIKISS